MDISDPAAPRIVHAFMPRNSTGYTITETWDVLGMRATSSDDTVLDGVVVPDRYIARVVPAGAAGVDAFVLGIFAWALLGFGNIYYGMALRARDLIVDTVKQKTSLGMSRPMSCHAGVQHGVGEMVIELEGIGPHLDAVAREWSDGVDHGAGWITKIVAAKYHAVESSWRVVDRALDVAGGFGIFRRSPLEQLFRDARLGRIHPANSCGVSDHWQWPAASCAHPIHKAAAPRTCEAPDNAAQPGLLHRGGRAGRAVGLPPSAQWSGSSAPWCPEAGAMQ
jgi:alkylation response protein AidB-like acyl-CoA dehydrogenase